MLQFENDILLELTSEDGLLILGKGLGLERILVGLTQVYNGPGHLVLVVGAGQHEAEWVAKSIVAESGGELPKPGSIPRLITADLPIAQRSAVYLEGGVLFVSSRILVVDFLVNRVPAHLITGIIVWKAHNILESCQEAFILRLYRQKNKTGFIKALSESAVSFTQGFCHVSRVMRNLFVKKLFLYPRFHLTVHETLEKSKPEVIELYLKMTPFMKSIQTSLIDLVAATVHELRLANKGFIDNDLLTVELAISPMFDRMVASLLQPVWEQLSNRVKTLVSDLRLLKMLSCSLFQYDSVTFYSLTSSLRTTERALQSSGWMLLPPAESLFINAKKRVFGENAASVVTALKEISKIRETNPQNEKIADENEKDVLQMTLEVNPKWQCLEEVLEEIRENARNIVGPLVERCLIVTGDDATAQQLKDVLVHGSDKVLQKLFYQTVGRKLNLIPPADLFTSVDQSNKRHSERKMKKPISQVQSSKRAKVVEDLQSSKLNKEAVDVEPADNLESTKVISGNSNEHGAENPVDDNEIQILDTTITLTQINEKYKFIGESSDSESDKEITEVERERKREVKRQRKEMQKKKYEEKKLRKRMFSSPLLLIRSLKNYNDPFSLTRTLRDVQPRFVIMYDADLVFIRQLEAWQAEIAPHQCQVYLMVFKGTTEEQIYLTQIKREKDAFHYLIKEKASLVFPEHAEGRTDDHPDLQRDPRSASELNAADSAPNTRKGGQPVETKEEECRVIVDMREFRSELPALLHRRGIDIEPVTVEVGDYILSPDMCVERKSLSDLVSSLNSGRLYSQAVAMSRHYSKPMLLIEFDQNKPFHLQASVLTNSRSAAFGRPTAGEPDNRDVCAKLQLLTLHFPRLRLLWCSSPYATAEMFHILKQGKPQPDVSKAQAAKSDGCTLDELEKFNPAIYDFVSKLPGVTTKNINGLMRGVKDLPALLALDKPALTALLGHSLHAEMLYASLHANLKGEDLAADLAGKSARAGKGNRGGSAVTRKGLPKFSK